MNIAEAKSIQISDYLRRLGYFPRVETARELWYCSPLRNERTPSFKVNLEFNSWFDFGLGKGGNILDLVIAVTGCSDVSSALKRIDPSLVPVTATTMNISSFPQPKKKSSAAVEYENVQIKPLRHPALLQYLTKRGIDVKVAQNECREVYYTYKGKYYFGVAFPNMSDGWEIRNAAHFKGCMYIKDISLIEKGQTCCYVFEGFFDYLAWLTYLPAERRAQQDYIVLNSVGGADKAIKLLKNYDSIHTFLDNDDAGHAATNKIMEALSGRVIDESDRYQGYKDVNEWWLDFRNANQYI